MCGALFKTPDLPAPPPPPPPPPEQGARKLFEPTPTGGEPDEKLIDALGLEQLRIRPPRIST